MRPGLIAIVTMVLAACGGHDDARDANVVSTGSGSTDLPVTPTVENTSAKFDNSQISTARWTLQSDDDGVTLALRGATTGTVMRLVCRSEAKTLLVNVPGFRPVGSEERLSFGSGGEAEALVADTGGDGRRGGVSASGAIPAKLVALIDGPLSVSYGAQVSGPHPALPRNLARAFVAACNAATDNGRERLPSAPPCMTQGTERLRVRPLRAVGTEPFWGARIEGRCVTYSHPEDPDGTRVWTRYQDNAGGGTWSGSLNGQRFELRTRAAIGCSDDMSNARYPIVVELIVQGERRSGCAQPAKIP